MRVRAPTPLAIMTDPAASLDYYFTQVKKAILNHQVRVKRRLNSSVS